MKIVFLVIGAFLVIYFTQDILWPVQTAPSNNAVASSATIIVKNISAVDTPNSNIDICERHKVEVLVTPMKDRLRFEGEVNQYLEKISASHDQFQSLEPDAPSVQRIALFSLASHCSPTAEYYKLPASIEATVDNFSSKICRSIPAEYRIAPLKLLRAASKDGSPELKLAYAENLLVEAKLLEFVNRLKTRGQVDNLRAEAEQVGREAAGSGLREAFLFMTKHYENGGFGLPDLKRSYLYAIAIADQNKTLESVERVNYLYQSMTAAEVTSAREIISQCKSASRHGGNSAYRNPF
ncbi:hypothetical protein [Massilia sp. CCM 8734]|uniref:hypothetical protein n=1 Tax=Massilia sp. CCM 8734 TaxID=2609283 RepID=UPI00141FB387|nr:hypothetical protein [Massilia sp. CCM 8734]NIA00848.1 hypothetical protein [Massilia sp. CCM 8734]